MRECRVCNETRNYEDFYPFRKWVCKKCLIKELKERRRNNLERYRENSRNSMRKMRANPEYRKKQAEYYRQWYKTKGRKRSKNYVEIVNMWRKLNPKKCHVYHLIEHAIKAGKIIQPKICEICKEERKLLAHHEDYKFPFKIQWLCYSCHKKIHNNKPRA